jgi:hypothetical protein
MAIDLTLKSPSITNRESTPKVFNNPGSGNAGILRQVQGYLASVTASLSATSVIRLCEIDAYAVVDSVEFASAAQGAGNFSIGLYKTNADGGAVVDADFFASRIDAASAVVITAVTNESTTNTIAKQNQPLWQAAGVSTAPAPGTKYDVCATVDTTDVTTGTGAIGVKVRYTI